MYSSQSLYKNDSKIKDPIKKTSITTYTRKHFGRLLNSLFNYKYKCNYFYHLNFYKKDCILFKQW